MDPTRDEDWYDSTIREKSGIDDKGRIPFYHDQALWDCRQYPTIHAAFSDLYQTTDLLVSLDRVNMNPPWREDWNYDGFIHWDVDVGTPRRFQVSMQGVLSLSDVEPGAGGFQCVKGFQHQIDGWLARQPLGYEKRFPDTAGMIVSDIPMEAGDFLIWNELLPHGNTRNRSKAPRLAQYITMFPAKWISDDEREKRLNSFCENTAPTSPNGKPLPGSPKEPLRKGNIKLSQLGRQLLGYRNHSND